MIKLTPPEILFLNYINNQPIEKKEFASYFSSHYKINSMQVLEKLIKNNIIYRNNDIRERLQNLKKEELKEILKNNFKETSGKNIELIDKIIKEVSISSFENLIPKAVYSYTDLGEKISKENTHIPFFHRLDWEISLEEVNQYKNENPELTNEQLAKDLLYRHMMINKKRGDWGLYRCNMVTLFKKILFKEKEYHQCLSLLLEICYIDLSGLKNGFQINYFGIHKKYFFKNNLQTLLAPAIIAYINTIVEQFLKLEKRDFIKLIADKIFSFEKTPIHLFTKKEVIQIIYFFVYKNEDGIQRIYSNAKKRFEKDNFSVINSFNTSV